MKLQLLNKLLTSDSTHTANFLFPPIVLPITETGMLVPESLATNKHFTTLVFVKELDDFCIFEFSQQLLDGLLAYRARHGTMFKFDVLLSRRDDGVLNMTIGANNLNNADELKIKAERGKDIHNKLYSAYQDKQEYVVFEMKGKV